MSDQGFNIGSSDDEISLSMGLDTVGLDTFEPVPEGTHTFLIIEPPEKATTKAGETMLVMKCIVEASPVEGAVGKHHTERLVIPGPERRQSNPDTWETMMKMLRRKLEAITGQAWREESMSLRPRELSGHSFIATVKHKANTYTKTFEDGTTEERSNVNAELNNWMMVGGNSSGNQEPPSGPTGFKL